MRTLASISWSGGKDCAYALYKILGDERYHVTSLHCVINSETKRVGMHGVHEDVIERQAEAIGLPLTKLYLEPSASHEAYERLMLDYYDSCVREGISSIVFGDIFLEDLRSYREQLMSPSGLNAIYPLWRDDTRALIRSFLAAGFRTALCAVDAAFFSEADAGRSLDSSFIDHLPPAVDPCGENGEFHTLVYDGPIFKKPFSIIQAQVVKRSYSFKKLTAEGMEELVERAFWFAEFL